MSERLSTEQGPETDIMAHPDYNKVLEEESLQYLKWHNKEWFDKNYNGTVSEKGYLLDKNGEETNFLPSQCITGGWDEVQENVRKRIGQIDRASSRE
ncbi:MAG: hypothetical protein ABIH38_04935 [Patescibacteria group bacterium]